jgi:hypothetical protein
MDTITIPKEKYKEILEKAERLSELQNNKNSELREQIDPLTKSSSEEASEFFAKHDL